MEVRKSVSKTVGSTFLYSKYTFDFSCDKLLSDKFVFFNIDVSVWQTETSHSRKYLPAYYSGMFRAVHAVFNSWEQAPSLVLLNIISSLVQGFPTLELLKFWNR